jgi:uncharacterized lipoprotein YbaY
VRNETCKKVFREWPVEDNMKFELYLTPSPIVMRVVDEDMEIMEQVVAQPSYLPEDADDEAEDADDEAEGDNVEEQTQQPPPPAEQQPPPPAEQVINEQVIKKFNEAAEEFKTFSELAALNESFLVKFQSRFEVLVDVRFITNTRKFVLVNLNNTTFLMLRERLALPRNAFFLHMGVKVPAELENGLMKDFIEKSLIFHIGLDLNGGGGVKKSHLKQEKPRKGKKKAEESEGDDVEDRDEDEEDTEIVEKAWKPHARLTPDELDEQYQKNFSVVTSTTIALPSLDDLQTVISDMEKADAVPHLLAKLSSAELFAIQKLLPKLEANRNYYNYFKTLTDRLVRESTGIKSGIMKYKAAYKACQVLVVASYFRNYGTGLKGTAFATVLDTSANDRKKAEENEKIERIRMEALNQGRAEGSAAAAAAAPAAASAAPAAGWHSGGRRSWMG